ncbi:GTPase HflX [Clostridium cellulovorans]|uniref:GTPase HflX n=1 Tax=Clostridium cellulovorans (strain ATCC 35296 / DSM 3052 / OCM 3 / 743B) TaxID=573061 RepID=D9SMX8_CLOC7|nr:GTPase HflX [Clostridium cellulovorans]ADL51844.1 GTP-binding proten HflX [Clostridium cellulovorans 743B]
MINGNIEGVKNSFLAELEDLYKLKAYKDQIATVEMVNTIVNVTKAINREVSIAIDRKGNVIDVSIGDSATVNLPMIDLKEKRLCGVKVLHTHPSGNSNLSVVDTSALLKLKLDAMIAVGVTEDGITDVTLGFCALKNEILVYDKVGPMSLEDSLNFNYLEKVNYVESFLKNSSVTENEEEEEIAIVVGVDNEESLDELEELANACNVKVVYKVLQKKNKIDNLYYIGSGKAEELALIKQVKGANLIIFDDELSGIQVKNLEEVTGTKVIDRTILILEIFARRAKSREAKIQVELAQLKYRSARLIAHGITMSRTGGGIGTRGPGEKKLEIDRRRIKDDIHDLRMELEKIRKNRAVQREKRSKSNVPKISLVGYTNAGKSTLRNALAEYALVEQGKQKDKVFEADMLFATLDVTTRAILLRDKRVAALTDTVGFIRKLSHDLVEAFKSTLEEVIFADLLLHVVDSSSDIIFEQIEATHAVLKELNAFDKPIILVLNKVDKENAHTVAEIKEKYKEFQVIPISAKNGTNFDGLMEMIVEFLPNPMKKVEFLIPYSDGDVGAYLHRNAIIEEEDYLDNGTKVIATVDIETYNKFNKFIVNEF